LTKKGFMTDEFCLTQVGANNLEIGLFRYEMVPGKRFTDVNSSLYRMFGCASRRDFLKIALDDLFVDSTEKEIFLKILQRNKNIKLFEASFRHRSGKPFWASVTAACVFTKNNTECIEGIIQDISSKKSVHNSMLMERDFLKNLLDNIPDAVYFKDKNNRIMKVNKFYIKGTGLREEEILGKTDFDFFPYEQAKQMLEDDNYVLLTGKPIVGKIEKTNLPNGDWNQVITTKIPMYDHLGKVIGTMGITRDMTAHANLEAQRVSMMINALEVLGKALEMRDPYTFSHTRHVAGIAEEISRALGWNEDRLLAMKLAGELHDLGKISIPLDILNKAGTLHNLEYSLIREHVKNCYNLIKDIEFPFPLAEIIYQHHERLDGSGYPRGLRGDGILMEARILAVSDVLEAMTHHRPYRAALGLKKACQELEEGKNIRYDSEIVDVAFKLIRKNGRKEFWIDG
jgi:PAS domain S-box-containing protein/putative nucleotidyltransferase with HDIG domain